MASTAYLKLKGQKQGAIKGSVTQKGRVGSILVIATHHEIAAPRDVASGVATGKRSHKPLVITKEIDQSTPPLYSALVSNEPFAECELEFWRAGSTGVEEPYFTIRLTKAIVARIEFVQPDTRNPEMAKYGAYQNVSFAYQKIEWTWTKGGIAAVDDWQASAG
jgi:type VI secretion system secreted protein Hcp